MRTLLDKPLQAIKKLQQLKVGALFMEPGTAKTSAAHALINSIKGVDYVLYLAPYQAINTPNYNESIVAEIESCGGFSMPHEFIGIESLSNSGRIYLELIHKLEKAKNPAIICDESLKIKNSDAKRTQRIIELGKLARYKLVLNGTPLSRNLLDLWSQMEFLSPTILKMQETQFKNTFCEYVTMTKCIGYKKIIREWIDKYHNLDYLYSLIGPFVFEADLEIDAKKQYINIPYLLTDSEIIEHNRLKEKYLDNEAMEARNNNIFLEITQKLQHSYSLSPEKFKIIDRILSKNDRSKVVICAKYIDTQKKLKEIYPDIRILSWQKNSFSLNLQNYNILIKWDKHWDYALHDQLEHRIYRTG